MVLLLCYTKCIISRWAWSAYWLAFNNCRLWDSSYRCGSNNECSELLRFKFWLSMMYSFRKFSLNWIFPKKSLLSSSFQVSSEISNSRVEFSETLENRIFCDSSDSHKYRSVNLSLTSTLHHWSQNLLFLLFLSLATDSRLRAFLAFRLRNKITNEKLFETEDSNTVETPNRPVFSIMFFEKSEKLWFGSLMSVVSSSTEVFLTNSLVWVICVCIWLGQVAKLLDASAELRVSIASRTGRGRQESGQERDVEVSVQENSKDGWDTREKARWRETTDVQIPFYRHLSRAYMWHAWQCVKCAVRASCAHNNVCATKSMYIIDTCLIVGLLLPLIIFFTASPSWKNCASRRQKLAFVVP